jgi:hypothetical protein
MKTLSKREKLIVSLVGVTALLALFVLLLPAKGTGTAAPLEKQAAALNDFSAQIALKVAQNGISNFEAAAIERVVRPWQADPFIDLPSQYSDAERDLTNPAAGETAEAAELTYSGYMQMGQRKLAIINGLEYEVGEHLADYPSMALQNISSSQVVFVQTDKRGDIVLHIEEE